MPRDPPTRREGYRRTTSSVASDTFPSRGRLGTRDVVDAVPYDGIENGERKTKIQIESKKTTRGKGFPGVSLRASGVPVCEWFSS